MEIFVFDSSNYETFKLSYFESIHQNAAPSTWTYVLLQAVAGMAKESLCYPNSKHTKMDIHRFDSSAAIYSCSSSICVSFFLCSACFIFTISCSAQDVDVH